MWSGKSSSRIVPPVAVGGRVSAFDDSSTIGACDCSAAPPNPASWWWSSDATDPPADQRCGDAAESSSAPPTLTDGRLRSSRSKLPPLSRFGESPGSIVLRELRGAATKPT